MSSTLTVSVVLTLLLVVDPVALSLVTWQTNNLICNIVGNRKVLLLLSRLQPLQQTIQVCSGRETTDLHLK
jgi:hypothetical protein